MENYNSTEDIIQGKLENTPDIYDFAESLSDYASMDMDYGYVLLSDFYIDNDNILHCLYDYYYYDDNTSYDSIDFIIDLSQYASDGLYTLNSYIEEFAAKIRNAFEKFL